MTTLFDTKPAPAYQAPVSSPLTLPEPQPRFRWPDPPGKRPDGKLWFEGPPKRSVATVAEDHSQAKRGLASYGDELKPRDFRQGDRWLPWHFDSEGKAKP